MRIAKVALMGALLAGWAAAADRESWQNLAALKPGQRIDVRAVSKRWNGEFVRFDAQALTLRDKKGEHSIAQAEVTRVTLPKRSRGIWIGAIAGAGGGLVVGAAAAERLNNESGGDFANLKPAVIAITSGAGALIGTGIGAAVRRTTVIYQR
jgi:hypothetical protein